MNKKVGRSGEKVVENWSESSSSAAWFTVGRRERQEAESVLAEEGMSRFTFGGEQETG